MKRFAIRSARALRAKKETTQILDRAEFIEQDSKLFYRAIGCKTEIVRSQESVD